MEGRSEGRACRYRNFCWSERSGVRNLLEFDIFKALYELVELKAVNSRLLVNIRTLIVSCFEMAGTPVPFKLVKNYTDSNDCCFKLNLVRLTFGVLKNIKI